VCPIIKANIVIIWIIAGASSLLYNLPIIKANNDGALSYRSSYGSDYTFSRHAGQSFSGK